MNPITIVLADDHHVVRQGLRALLETEPGFKLVGEAGDGLEAMRLVEHLKPQVLIVDLMMPSLNGLEVARQVSHRLRHTKVLVLSMHSTDAYVLEALKNGATGYVLKGSHASDLIQGVREVAAGRRYLSPPLSERAIEFYVQKADAGSSDFFDALTAREREVFHLMAEPRLASGYSLVLAPPRPTGRT